MSRHIVRAWQSLQAAEAETGIMGMDSAAETYRAAIRQLGHKVPAMSAEGMRTAWMLAKKRGPSQSARLATDAKTIGARAAMFPNANRLGKVFF